MSQSPNISEQAPGAKAGGQVTAGKRTAIRFGVAERADDPEIRALLRATPMAGAISLSLEREPNFFADHDLPGEVKTTIVAKQDGRTFFRISEIESGCGVRRSSAMKSRP